MLKRLTSLLLIVVFGGSLFAGVPLHSGEQACSINEMMDCCLTAQMQGETPEVTAARLCCALQCSQSAPVETGISVQVPPPLAGSVALYPIEPHPSVISALLPHLSSIQARSPTTQPTYIRHLALLI